jgi:hypothetical protein
LRRWRRDGDGGGGGDGDAEQVATGNQQVVGV